MAQVDVLATPDYRLIDSRAKTMLRVAGISTPPAGLMQARLLATSRAYLLYDMGARKGFAVVGFDGMAEEVFHSAVYLIALAAFCQMAGMPPLHGSTSPTWTSAQRTAAAQLDAARKAASAAAEAAARLEEAVA